MRAKEIWALVPVPSHVVKKVSKKDSAPSNPSVKDINYSSVTLSKITALYFLFALLHMFVQGGFQIASHVTNHNANAVLEAIRSKASVEGRMIPVITPNQDGSGDTLRVCNGIPQSDADQTCQPVFNAPSNDPRPKHHRDQDPTTTTSALQDNVSSLSSISLASQTPARNGFSPFSVAPPAIIAPTATASIAAGATKAVDVPAADTIAVESTKIPSPSSPGNATPPAPFTPSASPPAPSPAAPAPAPGRGAPSRAATPAPAPSIPAQAPSQASAPPPAPSSDPPLFVLSVPQVNPLPISKVALPIPELRVLEINKPKTTRVSNLTSVAPAPSAATSFTGPPPAPSVSVGFPDVGAVIDPVVDTGFRILDVGQSETTAPTSVVKTAPPSSVSVPSSVSEETPASSIGLPNVDDVVKIVGDGGNPQATPSPQPVAEGGQTSTPAVPTSTETANLPGAIVNPVVDPVIGILAIGEPETIAPPIVSGSVVEALASSTGLPNVGEALKVVSDILSSGDPRAAPQPTEIAPTPVSEVGQSNAPVAPVEPTSTDAGKSAKQETTDVVKETTDVVKEAKDVVKETTEAGQGVSDAVNNTAPSAEAVIGGLLGRRTFHVEPITNQTSGEVVAVNITDLTNSGSDEVVTVNRTCARALILPHKEVLLAQKQDFVMLGYYIWLFALAFVAVVNQSTPHLVAAWVSSVLAVVWSVYQVLHTRAFQSQFDRFITNGACNGVQLMPNYWKQRAIIEIPSLVLNCVFALILGGFAFKLVGSYRRSTSKLVGGQKFVGQLYKIVLVLTIVVQVTMFLIIASLALWVDQLFEGTVASFSKTAPIFKGIAITSLVFALPWFILCWIAVRKENKPLMVAFFIVTTLFIASLCSTFRSDAFALIFSDWPFFASLTVASLFGLVISLGLSVLCRMRFGRGLASQLAANSKAEDETMPWDFASNTEKAWRAYEVLPDPSDGHQGQPQLHAMNVPGSGTANWYIDGYRM